MGAFLKFSLFVLFIKVKQTLQNKTGLWSFINDITHILNFLDPPPSSVTLKLQFYLHVYT